MHALAFLHLTFERISHHIDIFLRWKNSVLQILETWLKVF